MVPRPLSLLKTAQLRTQRCSAATITSMFCFLGAGSYCSAAYGGSAGSCSRSAMQRAFATDRSMEPNLRDLMLNGRTRGGYDAFLEQITREDVKKQFLNSVGAIVLLLNGFKTDWSIRKPGELAKDVSSWHRVTPTWKETTQGSKGPLDFSVEAQGEYALQKMNIGFTGTSIAELADFLKEKVNLSDYSIGQLRMMFQWDLVPGSPWAADKFSPDKDPVNAIFAFSFSAAEKDCVDPMPDKCGHPGRANEMLGKTVLRYLEDHPNTHGICQWEIATAMKKMRQGELWNNFEGRVHAVGSPGVFQNSVEVNNLMVDIVEKKMQSCPSKRIAVLAHPDHLPRAYITVRTAFAKSREAGTLSRSMRAAEIIPALFPYDLGWPKRARESYIVSLFRGRDNSAWFEGTGFIQKNGNPGLGYFADGSQGWTYDRRTFLLYELWARAKTFAKGGLSLPETWPKHERSDQVACGFRSVGWTIHPVGYLFYIVMGIHGALDL